MEERFEGIEHIRGAAEILATRDSRLKKRLVEAGDAFWSALYHLDKWPRDLRERAEKIQEKILAKGRVKETVSAMDRETAIATAAEILNFMVDFQLASGGRPPSNA